MRKHINKLLRGVQRMLTGQAAPAAPPPITWQGPAGAPPPAAGGGRPPVRETRKPVANRPASRPGQPAGSHHPQRSEGSRRSSAHTPGQPPPTAGSPRPAVPWDPAAFQVPPAAGKMRFQDFPFTPEILHAIADEHFQYCTPIQAQILPHTLAGKDAGGQAQTGTGKTAAFLLTILQHAHLHPLPPPRKPGAPRALVLAPTRELCQQIQRDAVVLGKYADFYSVAVFGGMDYEKQQHQLRNRPVDLISATPGRLLDFLRSRVVDLSKVEILVIDEADRMLDMGFIPDVRRIISQTPPKDRRQTLLFSATLSPEVLRLASQWMRQSELVQIEPEHLAVDTVQQTVYIVTAREKYALLLHLLKQDNAKRILIFRNRRDAVTRLARRLAANRVPCAELSGDVPQERRQRILEDFRSGRVRVVVATDVAGRGIHVEAISHVVNYDIPEQPEDFVHRIGRTGRAGHAGEAICFADESSSFLLPQIEAFIGRPLVYAHPEDAWLKLPDGFHAPAVEFAPSRSGARPFRSRGPRRGPPHRR